MGIFNAMYAGVNGINSNGNAISIIGDNISNVNTVGFKASRPEFEDILTGANTGLGSRITGVSALFSQGGFESTSSVTDMAIDGRGFFVVQNPTDGSNYFSRAGQFVVDKDGFLVTSDGYQLQGYTVDENNNLTSNIGSIEVSQAPVPPKPTGTVTLAMNLDSNEDVPAAFSATNPTGTSNFSAGITVYDSLGNGHLATMFFRKTAANNWAWYTLVDGGEITGGAAGTYEIEANGTVVFNEDGTLKTMTTTTSDFDFVSADDNQAITFNFGESTDAGGEGLDGVTQFGSDSAITNIFQNGYASGSLRTIDIGKDGTISGNYTNGTTQTIAQVVLATFSNEIALTRAGSNNYTETLDSGSPLFAAPNSSGKGSVISQTLEQSNVDLASELIRMVIIQRGFQANTRTISTVNDMLAQLVTLGQ